MINRYVYVDVIKIKETRHRIDIYQTDIEE